MVWIIISLVIVTAYLCGYIDGLARPSKHHNHRRLDIIVGPVITKEK